METTIPGASNPRTLDAEVVRAFPGVPKHKIRSEAFTSVPYRSAVDAGLLEKLISFISGALLESSPVGYSGLAVGLSGGVDSVVTAALCRRACPSRSDVVAVTVLMGDDEECARLSALSECAAAMDLPHIAVDGRDAHRALVAAWSNTGPWSRINIETRVVQSLIFQVADSRNAAVVATTDRSEFLLGRYTEGFYGQVAPLLALFKSEVYDIAHELELRSAIRDLRPGCEGHWYDDEVLGVGYEIVDPLLYLLVDENRRPSEICSSYGIQDRAWVNAFASRILNHSLRTTTRAFERNNLGVQ